MRKATDEQLPSQILFEIWSLRAVSASQPRFREKCLFVYCIIEVNIVNIIKIIKV